MKESNALHQFVSCQDNKKNVLISHLISVLIYHSKQSVENVNKINVNQTNAFLSKGWRFAVQTQNALFRDMKNKLETAPKGKIQLDRNAVAVKK